MGSQGYAQLSPVHIISISGTIQNPTLKPCILLFLMRRHIQPHKTHSATLNMGPWVYETCISKIDEVFSLCQWRGAYIYYVFKWCFHCVNGVEYISIMYSNGVFTVSMAWSIYLLCIQMVCSLCQWRGPYIYYVFKWCFHCFNGVEYISIMYSNGVFTVSVAWSIYLLCIHMVYKSLSALCIIFCTRLYIKHDIDIEISVIYSVGVEFSYMSTIIYMSIVMFVCSRAWWPTAFEK